MIVSKPKKSVKEARKLLGKRYSSLSDDDIEIIVTLVGIIADEQIQSTVRDK